MRIESLVNDRELELMINNYFDVFEDISLLYKNVFNEQGVQIFEATNKGLY